MKSQTKNSLRHSHPFPAMGLVAVLALAGAACGDSAIDSSKEPHVRPPVTAKSAPVSVRLQLPGNTFTSGSSPVDALVIIDNASGRPIKIENGTCRVDGVLAVGLWNAHVGFDPAFAANACFPQASLMPGVSRFKVTIDTTYQSCVPTTSETGAPDPIICAPDSGPPGLPAGKYSTKIVWGGAPPGTVFPKPTTVTLKGTPGSSTGS